MSKARQLAGFGAMATKDSVAVADLAAATSKLLPKAWALGTSAQQLDDLWILAAAL